MNKLEYDIKSMYYLKPSVSSERYEEIILSLLETGARSFVTALADGEIPDVPIILNLKEIVYFDLFFEFANKSPSERQKLFKVYSHVIRISSELLRIVIHQNDYFNKSPIESYINSFITYTQFWDTHDWGDNKDEIHKLQEQHKKEIVVLAYTILHSIILQRISPIKAFRICEKLIDIVGFLNVNELIDAHFDDAIVESGVHWVRFDEIYFPTIFLLLEYYLYDNEAFSRLFYKYIETEKDTYQRSSILEVMIDKLKHIEDAEILSFQIVSKSELSTLKENYERYLYKKLEELKADEADQLVDAEVDGDKWNSLLHEIKDDMLFEEFSITPSENYELITREYRIALPKRTLIKSSGFNMIKGFTYAEIIDQILTGFIQRETRENIVIEDIDDVPIKYDILFIPQKYVNKIWMKYRRASLSNIENSYYDTMAIKGRHVQVRWVNKLESIYAFSSENDFFLIDYTNIEIELEDTKRKDNQVISIVKIIVPFFIPKNIEFDTFVYD